jgi:hypothetical protein
MRVFSIGSEYVQSLAYTHSGRRRGRRLVEGVCDKPIDPGRFYISPATSSCGRKLRRRVPIFLHKKTHILLLAMRVVVVATTFPAVQNTVNRLSPSLQGSQPPTHLRLFSEACAMRRHVEDSTCHDL